MKMFSNKLNMLSLALMALSTLNGLAITGSVNNGLMRRHGDEDHGDNNTDQNGAPSENNNQGSAPPSTPNSKAKPDSKNSDMIGGVGGDMLSGLMGGGSDGGILGGLMGGGEGGDPISGLLGGMLGGGGGDKKSEGGSMLSSIPFAGDLIGGIIPF